MTNPSDMIPGKELEKAAAEVASDAGKSFVRGIARTLGAATAEWVAKKEAKADAIRKAIETRAELDRTSAIINARRSSEISEIDHQAKMRLAERRAQRMIHEMAQEQENIEAIVERSLKRIEAAGPKEKARELDSDWLLRFARFAETVSDKDVQEIWARILESAAIDGRPKLSAASLLQLSLVDREAAASFNSFVRAYQSLGLFPDYPNFHKLNVLGIDLMKLEELGLVRSNTTSGYQFSDFFFEMGNHSLPPIRAAGTATRSIPMLHTACDFTQRGAEIANALYAGYEDSEVRLPVNEEKAFLQDFLTQTATEYRLALVRPNIGAYYFVVHLDGQGAERVSGETWQLAISEAQLTSRVRDFLDFANTSFLVSVHQMPQAA